MYKDPEMVDIWGLHKKPGDGSYSPGSYLDPYSEDNSEGEENREREEIEAMLYSQLYFEPHDNDGILQCAASVDYDVDIKNQTDQCENEPSSFAGMVNFTGRNFMSPSNATPDRPITTACDDKMSDNIKSAQTNSHTEDLEPKETDSTVKTSNQTKKKKRMKEIVIVIPDSNDEDKQNGNTSSEKKSATKRRAKKADTVPTKKTKKEDNDTIVLVSSDSAFTGSDVESDLYIDDCSDDDISVDLNLNVQGLWNGLKDPRRQNAPDLSTINIKEWNGDPPLTIEEIHSLLKGCNWHIDDDDKYGLMRSYGQSKVVCKNCNERGHRIKDCQKPKKVPKCALCGEDGHMYWWCPNTLCYNCNLPGHSTKTCSAPRKSYSVICNRCGYPGHIQSFCPEIWRQYHMTTKPGPLQVSEQKENKAAFCYNCGKKGHYGYECCEKRVNAYLQPLSPFVTHYKEPRKFKKKKEKVSNTKCKDEEKHQMMKPVPKKSNNKNLKRKAALLKDLGLELKGDNLKDKAKQSRKESKKNKTNLSAVPSFFRKTIQKGQQKAKSKAKKTFDEECDNFPRNKQIKENTKKKKQIEASTSNVESNKQNKSKKKRKSKKLEFNQLAKKAAIISERKRCPTKPVHTIFDTPTLCPSSNTSNKHTASKINKNDRKVVVNKRGFRMTINN